MNILIFIDHNIMIRHFIDSGVFHSLSRLHNVAYILPEDSKRVMHSINADSVGAEIIKITTNRLHIYCWRTLFMVNKLRLIPGKQASILRRIYKCGIPKKIVYIYTLLGIPGIYSLFKLFITIILRLKPYVEMEQLVNNFKADILIHPSVLAGIFIDDVIDVAKRHKIPSVVIINSWDNPSTKHAVAGEPDWLLVWGEQTRLHAQQYMKMPYEKVICFGAAQFDVYNSPPKITRSQFCQREGIEPRKKILLYAGSSKGTEEFKHLLELDNAIEKGELPNIVVVYRPHPWGNAGKGGERIFSHQWRHVVLESTMTFYLEQISHGNKSMSFPPYTHTHDVLSSVDAVISPLSTIILEAAMHGKPVMCFLPDEDDKDSHYSVALPMVHFEDMFNIPEIIIARGDKELVPKSINLLKQTEDCKVAEKLKEACQYFEKSFDQPYGERLVKFIEGIKATGNEQPENNRIMLSS